MMGDLRRISLLIFAVVTPAVAALVLAPTTPCLAQTTSTTQTAAVGGVSISADGAIRNQLLDRQALDKVRDEALRGVAGQVNRIAKLRKVSLARLDEALAKAVADGKPLPPEMLFLAGLQQVRYVLVYPEQKDIVLAGPGEGWKVDDRGNVVGASSGRPVLALDDLLVALRAALAPKPGTMSCSINPTAAGLKRMESYSRALKAGDDPEAAAQGLQEQLGPQTITVQGVPATSRFARVMVAADYRMKRISMGLEASPIRGLTAFTELARAGGRGMQNTLPRWWLEPEYKPLSRDADGLAWELQPATVKAMTENDFFDASGTVHQTGKSDAVSQRWADMMTARYEELSMADPVFAELRNCMDLAVVTALLAKERLTDKAGNPLATLTGDRLATAALPAPKQVDSRSALIKKGKKTMIVSGGVQINPWQAVEKTQTSDKPTAVRTATAPQRQTTWWWD